MTGSLQFWIALGLAVIFLVAALMAWQRSARLASQLRELAQAKSSDARIMRALTAGGEELWELNPANGSFTRLINSLGVAGAHDGDVISIDALTNTAHPGDREIISDAINETLRSKGSLIEVTYRSKGADGRWLWIMVRGKTMKNEQGETLIVGASRDVTALKEGAQRLQLALNSAKEELWEIDLRADTLTRENVITYIDLPDVVRGKARDVLRSFLHPEDRHLLIKAFERAVGGEQGSFGATYRARHRDGGYIWLDSQGTATDFDAKGFPSRILGTTRDVSEIKGHEELLRAALWGSASELWDIYPKLGVIRREYDLPDIVLEGDGNEVRFRDVLAQVHPEDREQVKHFMVEKLTHQHESFEVVFRMRHRDGGWRWLAGRAKRLEQDDEGFSTRLIGTLQDITELKSAEAQLRELNDALEQRVSTRTQELTQSNATLNNAVQELQNTQRRMVDAEKMAALGGLVAGVAHEINTPIGVSVTAASHMDLTLKRFLAAHLETLPARDQAQLKAVRDAADIVMRNLRRADQLIKSFKQVAIDQSDDQMRVIRLREYLDEILIALKPAFKRRDIVVVIECPEELMLRTYPGAIYQIISNLVLNSIKHGFPDARNGEIRINAKIESGKCQIDYRDDGVGMQESIRQRVFEPFFTTKRGAGGSGLGMHIVFNLVTQRLKGHIDVQSAPEQGCHFHLEFPNELGSDSK